jgi:hypothetical protein
MAKVLKILGSGRISGNPKRKFNGKIGLKFQGKIGKFKGNIELINKL